MLKRALLLCAVLAPILAASLAPAALAQGPAVYITQARLPQSNDLKLPHIDTLDRTVLAASNAESSVARLWSKQDTAGSFGAPATMGLAEGDPDFTSAAVFVGPNGTIHYAWSDFATRQVLYRAKAPTDADFGPVRVVVGLRPSFGVEVEVAAMEDGVFVFWREPNRPYRFRSSPDGVNWNVPTQSLGAATVIEQANVAAIAGRRLAVAYTSELNGFLQGFVGLWSGTGFVIERIPTVPDRSFANPSVAFLPDGTLIAAIRSTDEDDGLGAGVYYSERSPAGAWSATPRLSKGDTVFVSVASDQLGNVHLSWINRSVTGNNLWYTSRRAGTAFGGSPLIVENGALPIFNVRSAANLSTQSYAHVIAERFEGRVPFGQYYLFGLPVNLVSAQSIAIEGGAQFTNKPALSVAFTGLSGNPTEVRWRWGAPPTDGANDSNGFQPLTNPITVATPPLADPTACTTLVLHTQLKAGSLVQLGTNTDTIVVDRAVQSAFRITNPFLTFDPGYTPIPTATLTIESPSDCAGLSAATVAGPIPGGSRVLDVLGKPVFQSNVDLTGGPGPKAVTFTATDLLGNTTAVSRTIIYDPTPPVLSDAGVNTPATADPDGTTIVDVTMSEVVAADDNRLFGITVTPVVLPAAGGPQVTGTPIVVPFSAMNSFTSDPGTGKLALKASVNLADGLPPSALVPGRYDLVITFTDAAGNQSLANTVRSIELSRITYPTHLPLIRR